MARFVLIHGAWHGGWCWELVAPLLCAAGHAVAAPDLPGMGADRTPLTDVSLESWAAWLADLLRSDGEPAILVGHSRGGIVISRAAELAPERVARLVYLAAFLVPDGGTLNEAARVDAEDAGSLLVIAPDGTSTVRPELVGPIFYNRTPRELVARAAAKLTPEPMSVFATPLRLTADRFGRVPRAYIETADDRIVKLDLQRAMQAALPCDPVVTLPTDHSPFYSAPDELARALDDLAQAG